MDWPHIRFLTEHCSRNLVAEGLTVSIFILFFFLQGVGLEGISKSWSTAVQARTDGPGSPTLHKYRVRITLRRQDTLDIIHWQHSPRIRR